MIESISHLNLPEFDLLIPHSLTEALELLEIYQANCKILAGGTDLLIELKQRLVQPKILIDIKNVPEMKKLEITDEVIIIGAAVPISDILCISQLKRHFTSFYQALREMCDEILRQRATVGGNICTASPAADTAGPLLVHQALLEVHSKINGKRIIPISDFFTGVKKNCLSLNEMLVSIILPKQPEEAKSAFKKFKRSAEDLALVGVTGLHSSIKTFLAYTAVAATPVLIDISEFFSDSNKIDEDKFLSIWKKVKTKISPISDVRSNKEFRLHITEILSRMILKEVIL
ncbi:MAG: FAD binding domain-containing protein [Candidatus Hodarchaeota archaeon]